MGEDGRRWNVVVATRKRKSSVYSDTLTAKPD